ncbi:MAG: hypothetical protein ABFD69_09645 [Candidatus Sumerlaeia bacterium]
MDGEVPTPIQKAANETLHAALVFCRNYSLRKDADPRCIYEVMEAIHEIPQSMNIWVKYNHDLGILRIHLMCFDPARWPGVHAPDLVGIFNNALEKFCK